MLLTTAGVQNFKCIEDSGEFTLDSVTCLVGKNESGKTALLQALYKLKPVVEDDGKYEDVEYPRVRWSEYQERKADKPDNVLTTVWDLEASDQLEIEKLTGPNCLLSRSVTVYKGYDNVRRWTVSVNEQQVVANFLQGAKLFQEEYEKLEKAESVEELLGLIKDLGEATPGVQALKDRLEELFGSGSVRKAIVHILDNRLPRFLYFSNYEKLPGEVSIDELIRRRTNKRLSSGDRIFLSLLELAGVKPEDIQNIGRFEPFAAQLEAVSNRISNEIFTYWSQNKHLEVQCRLDQARPQDPPPFNEGSVFRTRIRNTRHKVTVGFDDRSTGFVWFFSFLVYFSQIKKHYGDRVFVLLDEPGLTLHARAQADLLRYISTKLKPTHQVVYTTHSPFMIDPECINAVRTVEDCVKEDRILGTVVGDRVFSTDADTVFPLQAALGYDLTQTLFVGKDTLLVEGPSDLLYLKWFSQELERLGRKGLDQRWVITPSGGIDKVGSFVSLFGGNKLHVAVLTDYGAGDKAKVRTLRESDLLRRGHVFTAEQYAGQPEADVEDILGRDLYVALTNRCYNLDGDLAIPLEKSDKTPMRVVKEVEWHFAALPAEAQSFDHFSPATYLMEHGAELRATLPGLNRALDRFETLFGDINRLL